MFDQKRAIVVSMICIIFLFHPTLTLESLSVFLCNQIDAKEYRMTMHLEYRCYSWNHLKWSAFVGMPILLLWVIASPILALMILKRHRKNLEDWSIKKYMLIIYQGFKPEVYYWEFVNILRKVLIVSTNIFLSIAPHNYSLVCAIVILIFLWRIQIKLQPYKLKENNELELYGTIAVMITFFCGFIFAQGEDALTGFYILSTIIIFVCNGIFFLKWLFLMLIEVKWRNQHFQRTLEIFAILLLKGKSWRKDRFKTEETPISKQTPAKKATKKTKKKRKKLKKILKNGVKNAKNNKLNAKLYKIKALDKQFSSMRGEKFDHQVLHMIFYLALLGNLITVIEQSDNRLVLNSKTSRKQHDQSEENRVKLPEYQKDISQLIVEMSHEEEKDSTPKSLFKKFNERKVNQSQEESNNSSMQEVFAFTTENRKNRHRHKKAHKKRNDFGYDQEEDYEEKEDRYYERRKDRRS